MTEQRNHRNDGKLETLYREAGDVEPEAGLDRIIRARADQAAGTRRASNRMPWLGGLVTASVAIVAIAVVLQQAPPDGQAPDSFAPEESGEPEAFMAPSIGAQSQFQARPQRQSQLQPQPDVAARDRETVAELGEENVSSWDTPAQSANSLSEAAAEPRQRRSVVAEAEPAAAPPADQDDSTLDRIVVTGSRIIVPDHAALESRGAVIEKLREMIEAEQIDEAHRLLEAAVDLYPELELPDDIEQALDRPASNPTDGEAIPDPKSAGDSRGGSPASDNHGE